MMTATDFIVLAFAATNGLRIVAFVPQIVSLIRDDSGAVAVSCCTWTLFFISHVATVAYAGVVLSEQWMCLVFTVNAVCSAAIVFLTLLRRQGGKR